MEILRNHSIGSKVFRDKELIINSKYREVYSSNIDDAQIVYGDDEGGTYMYIDINVRTIIIDAYSCESLNNLSRKICDQLAHRDGTIMEDDELYSLITSAQQLLDHKFRCILDVVSIRDIKSMARRRGCLSQHTEDLINDAFRDPVMTKSARK